MYPRRLLLTLVPALCLVHPSIAQIAGSAAAVPEFPVILQQSVTAGKTPVGTKVQAKLLMATLVNGTVIPRNAVFSGEVIESTAKSAKAPSRVGIRMDSANWKNGSAAISVYMTDWYYPTVAQAGQNLQYGPPQDPSRTWNGAGAYPDPNSPAYKPFPGGDSDKDPAAPDTPNSVNAQHRVLMKNVEVEHGSGNAILLTSKHSNIKLDRFTTYVLASGDLPK